MEITKVTVATALAILFATTGVVLFSMGRHVASGTFFLFTAFTIYIREMNS